MRKLQILLAIGGGILFLALCVYQPQKSLIWNRTQSAPIGLYWIKRSLPQPGNLVVVSAASAQSQWAQNQGFVGKNWPLLKYVAGVPGDKICSLQGQISINGRVRAEGLKHDQSDRNLPVWQGCKMLTEGQVFLLNSHPQSLDGRYFGPTQIDDLDGVAILLFKAQ